MLWIGGTKAWRQNIDYRNSQVGENEKHYFDVTFVIDVSGSMSGTTLELAKTAVKNLISAMQYKDNAAIVTFNSSATLVCDLQR